MFLHVSTLLEVKLPNNTVCPSVWLVGLSVIVERGKSFTSMLLSEHLFCSSTRNGGVHVVYNVSLCGELNV